MLKYRSKQKRLVAIADAWVAVHGVTEFRTSEVADWALTVGLWPVPTRVDTPEMCAAWEHHLAEIAATGTVPQS